jgi:uncharacterized membrane protein YqjE
MVDGNHSSPGLGTLLAGVGRAALKGVHNRVELLAVEWQEERLRFADLMILAIGLVLLTTVGTLLATATIIFLFPENARIYVTGALAVVYLIGAVAVWLALRAALRRQPFAESIEQVKKDRVWLESLKSEN